MIPRPLSSPRRLQYDDRRHDLDRAGGMGVIPKRGLPFGLTISQHVATKFVEYRGSHNVPRDLEHYLWRSRVVNVDCDLAFAIRQVLRVDGELWRRDASVNDVMTLVFLGVGPLVVEVMSFRGIRQFKKLARRLAERPSTTTERDRLTDIYKHKRRVVMGGGLLNQNSGPKDRWNK